MKRRQFLASSTLGLSACLAGCSMRSPPAPQNDAETRHFSTDVWSDHGYVPDTRIFESADSALEHRVETDGGSAFETFARNTDFQNEYLALVQGIGVGAGNSLTVREKRPEGTALEITIDEWPPETNEPWPSAIFYQALATRCANNGEQPPSHIKVTIHRHDDRSLFDSLVDSARYVI